MRIGDGNTRPEQSVSDLEIFERYLFSTDVLLPSSPLFSSLLFFSFRQTYFPSISGTSGMTVTSNILSSITRLLITNIHSVSTVVYLLSVLECSAYFLHHKRVFSNVHFGVIRIFQSERKRSKIEVKYA